MSQTDLTIRESAQDLVALLDAETYLPVVDTLSPMRVTVYETSRLAKFEVEDGTQRTDHRVILPVEIDLPLLLAEDVRDQFEQLRSAWIEGRELIMQTKVRSYPGLMIAEMPHDEIPEQGESIPVSVRLQEIKTVQVQYGPLPPKAVAGPNSNPAQADTVKKGRQQATQADTATTAKTSVLYGVFN